MRFATFNLENLFARPKVFNLATWAEGEPILKAFAEFNALIERVNYTQANKARMIELLLVLEVYRLDNGVVRRNRIPDPKWAWLRANRGTFDVEHEDTGVEIVANRRFDWTGWLELAKEPVDEVTTNMTAQVILDVNADVQGVVEVEDRPVPEPLQPGPTRRPLRARHADRRQRLSGYRRRDHDPQRRRDRLHAQQRRRARSGRAGRAPLQPRLRRVPLPAAEQEEGARPPEPLQEPVGRWGPKRARQAQGLRDIVDALVKSGEKNLIVMGDLNEGPDGQGNPSQHFAPLYAPGSPLVDVFSLAAFDPGPKPGTFQSCSTTNRIDYIFVSKNLAPKVVGGGIERHGLWGAPTNKNPPSAWEIYPGITSSSQAASDHAAVFVDIDL